MLTTTQIAERAKGVGASDAGAILGLDPYSSAYDTWLRKTGKLGDVETNDAIEWGNDLEDVIGKRAARVLGRPVVRPADTFRHHNGVMLANVDFMADLEQFGPSPLEAKSTGIVDGWGEDGSDTVPDRVWAQVQVQMMCSRTQVAKVARILGRNGFKFSIYTVELAKPEMLAVIEERLCDFWHNNVQKDIPPEHSLPSMDSMSRVRRALGLVVPIDPALVTAFSAANRARIDAEKAEEKCKAALLAAMVKDGVYADGAECAAGTVSYKEVTRKGYVVETGSYRRLTVKAAQGAGT